LDPIAGIPVLFQMPQEPQTSPSIRVDEIVRELLEGRQTKAYRIELFRELVRAEAEVPDELFEAALAQLMEKLTG